MRKIKLMLLENWLKSYFDDAVRCHGQRGNINTAVAFAYKQGFERGFNDAVKCLSLHGYIDVAGRKLMETDTKKESEI